MSKSKKCDAATPPARDLLGGYLKGFHTKRGKRPGEYYGRGTVSSAKARGKDTARVAPPPKPVDKRKRKP